MQQRRKIGMRMKRLAKKIARTKDRKKRMKTKTQLKKTNKNTRSSILFKKMSGVKRCAVTQSVQELQLIRN